MGGLLPYRSVHAAPLGLRDCFANTYAHIYPKGSGNITT